MYSLSYIQFPRYSPKDLSARLVASVTAAFLTFWNFRMADRNL